MQCVSKIGFGFYFLKLILDLFSILHNKLLNRHHIIIIHSLCVLRVFSNGVVFNNRNECLNAKFNIK